MYATERIPLSKMMNIRNLTEKDFSELFKDEKNKKGEYRKFTRYIENAMKAKGMTPADRMFEGGQMVKSKRTRSIDGIASKGKTRGTQR